MVYLEGYKQEVRNYNLAMGSTNYFIKLEKPSLGHRIIAGGISPSCYVPDNNDENFVLVQTKKLDAKTKEILNRFSFMLKQNPNFQIDLQMPF